MTESLVLPPSDSANAEGTATDEEEGLMEAEVRLQKEEEKFKMYDKIYISLLSEEETSDMETDELTYLYFSKDSIRTVNNKCLVMRTLKYFNLWNVYIYH